MKFQSPFSNANFNGLGVGDFFFHPLSGGHSPAIKVLRLDKEIAVIDLNLEQQDGSRLPTLMHSGDFEDLTVVSVQTATIRPRSGIASLKNGAGGAGSIDRGSLMITPTAILLKVKGPNLATLAFDVVTGQQVSNPDSAKCLWTTEWQVVAREGDKDLTIFEH